MEFQSGQNCVTEIKDMLCAKYIKTLCYIENINIMCKMHKHHAQNTQMLCSKCRYTSWSKYTNVMLKMQIYVMVKMRKRYAQNAETLCSKYRNVMLKMQKLYAQKQFSVIRYTVREQALIRELT